MDGGGQRKSRVGQKEREDSGQEGGEKEAVSGRRSTKSATAKTAHCEWCVCVCVRERERERERARARESKRERQRVSARGKERGRVHH
jgi:hypothetical protein